MVYTLQQIGKRNPGVKNSIPSNATGKILIKFFFLCGQNLLFIAHKIINLIN